MAKDKESAATEAKARSEKARVAREDAHWGRCQGCDQERRRVEVGGVIVAHDRYDQGTGSMVFCEGSSLPPMDAYEDTQDAPAPAVFADAPVGAARPQEPR